jgi:hypothetical protein
MIVGHDSMWRIAPEILMYGMDRCLPTPYPSQEGNWSSSTTSDLKNPYLLAPNPSQEENLRSLPRRVLFTSWEGLGVGSLTLILSTTF